MAALIGQSHGAHHSGNLSILSCRCCNLKARCPFRLNALGTQLGLQPRPGPFLARRPWLRGCPSLSLRFLLSKTGSLQPPPKCSCPYSLSKPLVPPPAPAPGCRLCGEGEQKILGGLGAVDQVLGLAVSTQSSHSPEVSAVGVFPLWGETRWEVRVRV